MHIVFVCGSVQYKISLFKIFYAASIQCKNNRQYAVYNWLFDIILIFIFDFMCQVEIFQLTLNGLYKKVGEIFRAKREANGFLLREVAAMFRNGYCSSE